IVVLFVPIYIAINLACVGYYWRKRRAEFNPVLHGLIPIAGVAAFVPAFLAGAGIKAFRFIAPLTYPLSRAGLVAGIWTALGVIYLVWLSLRAPQRVTDTGKVFLEEPATEVPAPPAQEG